MATEIRGVRPFGEQPPTASAGFWDFDGPLPTVRIRVMRAAALSGVWAACLAPTALGVQRCTYATLTHRPCPGCGMTRAIHLLIDGRVHDSLRMHAFALPILLIGLALVGSTLWATVELGSPLRVHRLRFARATFVAGVVVYAAAFALWIARGMGYFGGPVPV